MLPSSEALSGLLSSLYEASSNPAMWHPFLQQLGEKTRATSGALLIHDFEGAKYSLSSSWQVHPELVRLYQGHYHTLDIWAQKGLAKPSGHVCGSQSLCRLPEMRSTEIYNDFMVRAGIEHGIFGILQNNRSCLASVSLYRDQSCPEFGSSDLDLLNFLAPHMQRAFKLHVHFAELRSRSEGLEDALNLVATGVMLLNAKGEVVLMNRSASALIQERNGLLVTRGGLRAERQRESELLMKIISEACPTSGSNSPSVGGTILVSRRERSSLHVFVSPIRDSSIPLTQSIAVVVFVIDPSQQKRPAQDVLRILFGLTPAESRVALLLGDGHSPRQIASMVGITDNTVRSQIKSIFCKTGVKRQAELVRLLLNHAGVAIRQQTVRT
jgi:DNA-binding CsgD family transcriptional regulator